MTPHSAVKTAAMKMTKKKLTWMPGTSSRRPSLRRREDVDALAAVDVGELLGAQPAHHERADGEEGHVAEVEQPGEADHDVQPEGHDDVGQGLDRGVEQVVGRASSWSRMYG